MARLFVLLLLALALAPPAASMPNWPWGGRPRAQPAPTPGPAEALGAEAPGEASAELDEDADLDAAFEAEFLLEEQALEAALEATSGSLGDPLEPANRAVLSFNRFCDKLLFEPGARLYGFVMPGHGKRALRRFFENLASTSILVNDLLQFEAQRAAVTGSRFVLNTTVGIAGLFDPATGLGLERHHADFGQTLWVYGVGSGPYVVLPLFGPSTSRDAFGRIVDFALRIDTWLLAGQQQLVLGVGDGLSRRELHMEALEELRRSSVDYYVALRSAYWMDRQAVLATSVEEPADDELPPVATDVSSR